MSKKTKNILLLQILLTLALMSCSSNQSQELQTSEQIKASFNPEAFNNDEEVRAAEISPVIDRVAKELWLSSTTE